MLKLFLRKHHSFLHESSLSSILFFLVLKTHELSTAAVTHYHKTSSLKGLPRWLSGKESACSAGDVDLLPGQEDPLEKQTAVF